MKTILKIISWIWQLPQNLVGFIMSRFAKETKVYKDRDNKEDIKVYFTSNVFNCGVSLGNYILLDYRNYGLHADEEWVYKTVLHEHGHQIQSRILGPLYLILVGFFSAICNNLWDRIAHKNWPSEKRFKWYYNRYPEKWADNLGKVNRWS